MKTEIRYKLVAGRICAFFWYALSEDLEFEFSLLSECTDEAQEKFQRKLALYGLVPRVVEVEGAPWLVTTLEPDPGFANYKLSFDGCGISVQAPGEEYPRRLVTFDRQRNPPADVVYFGRLFQDVLLADAYIQDAIQCLKRLPDVDNAFRATVLKQLQDLRQRRLQP